MFYTFQTYCIFTIIIYLYSKVEPLQYERFIETRCIVSTLTAAKPVIFNNDNWRFQFNKTVENYDKQADN